jgi:hypothetical protein
VFAANGSLCSMKAVTIRRRIARRVHGHVVHVLRTIRWLVAQPLSMPTTITGQNGAVIKQTTKIAVDGCNAVKSYKATKRKGGRGSKKRTHKKR